MMQRSRTQYIEQDGKQYLVTELDEAPNLEHIETVAGSTSEFYMDWELADTRKVRPAQRRLFFALLNDIMEWSITPKDFLKELFYMQYSIYTDGKEISLADDSTNSVSDGNILLDLVIDFMFTWRVPFKKGYELLPRNEAYYIFECCRHRVCCVCGAEHADIHHVDVIGSGVNRNHVDHTKRHVMCLCREHHTEIETIGPTTFAYKHHVTTAGIKLDAETLKRIGVQGNYSDNQRGS